MSQDKQAVLNRSLNKVNTTIGDLVELISKIAMQDAESEAEAYKIAAVVLQDLTKNSSRRIEIM